MRERFFELDVLRGVAITLMVLLHIYWDLDYFGFVTLNQEVYNANIACASLFFILVGICLTITSKRKKRVDIIKRGSIIFLIGMMITGASILIFPERPIYFGALHLIGASVIIGCFLVKYTYLNLALAALVVNIRITSGPSLDFFPFFPWFSTVLFGIFVGNILYKDGVRQFNLPKLSHLIPVRFTSFLGRHSLKIYIVHQPVIASFLLIVKFINV